MQTDPKQFAPTALQRLLSANWPGNARQLENEVKRLVASVRGKVIAEEHLDTSVRDAQEPAPPAPTVAVAASATEPSPGRRQTLPEAVEALERRMIEETLRDTRGNKQQAAQLLGLSRQGLIKMLKRLGIG